MLIYFSWPSTPKSPAYTRDKNLFLLTILMRFLNDRSQAGHMTALEAGTKPFPIPAKLASPHLSSSTRELSGAAPAWLLFPGLSSGNTFFLPTSPPCFLHRKKAFGCGMLFIA